MNDNRNNVDGLPNINFRPTYAVKDRLDTYLADLNDDQIVVVERMARAMSNGVGRWLLQVVNQERSIRSLINGGNDDATKLRSNVRNRQ